MGQIQIQGPQGPQWINTPNPTPGINPYTPQTGGLAKMGNPYATPYTPDTDQSNAAWSSAPSAAPTGYAGAWGGLNGGSATDQWGNLLGSTASSLASLSGNSMQLNGGLSIAPSNAASQAPATQQSVGLGASAPSTSSSVSATSSPVSSYPTYANQAGVGTGTAGMPNQAGNTPQALGTQPSMMSQAPSSGAAGNSVVSQNTTYGLNPWSLQGEAMTRT